MPNFRPKMPSIATPPLLPERLDLDVDASRQLQLHQRVDRLTGGLEDVEQPLVSADLELLPRLLVDVRRAVHRIPRGARVPGWCPRSRASTYPGCGSRTLSSGFGSSR